MKTPRQKLRKELDIVFKRFIRQRDGKCMKCAGVNNLHASHVIPVSHGDKFRWDEQNCMALCYHHHMNWWHKNPLEGVAWYSRVFKEEFEYLEKNNDGKAVKFSIEELEEKLNYYKEKLNEG